MDGWHRAHVHAGPRTGAEQADALGCPLPDRGVTAQPMASSQPGGPWEACQLLGFAFARALARPHPREAFLRGDLGLTSAFVQHRRSVFRLRPRLAARKQIFSTSTSASISTCASNGTSATWASSRATARRPNHGDQERCYEYGHGKHGKHGKRPGTSPRHQDFWLPSRWSQVHTSGVEDWWFEWKATGKYGQTLGFTPLCGTWFAKPPSHGLSRWTRSHEECSKQWAQGTLHTDDQERALAWRFEVEGWLPSVCHSHDSEPHCWWSSSGAIGVWLLRAGHSWFGWLWDRLVEAGGAV